MSDINKKINTQGWRFNELREVKKTVLNEVTWKIQPIRKFDNVKTRYI